MKKATIMEVKTSKLALEGRMKLLDRIFKIGRLIIVMCYYGI